MILSTVPKPLKNGDEYRADRIVSAADGYSTIFELLKGRFVDDGIRERHEKWPLFKPVVMISYGVNRKFPDDPWMVLIKPGPKISAGQWVLPGGGVIPSLMTGKHAAMLLCRQDGKKFEATLK